MRYQHKIKQISSFNRALTLLEVLIAVTIFSIVMSAIYSTFKLGMKAYDLGHENMDELQQVRFIFDTFAKDIRGIYYLDESAYNVQANKRIEEFNKEYNKALENDTVKDFLALYDKGLAKLLGKDEINVKENPYNIGISIDLNMLAEDNGDVDIISFVKYQLSDGEIYTEPWALARVQWSVENERLIRTESPVLIPERDLDGEVIEEMPARIDILSKNVAGFNLVYGYYCADRWLETDIWDCSSKNKRNPVPDLDPDDPEYDNINKLAQTLPRDGLPAYVRLELTLVDSKQKAGTEQIENRRPRFFSTTVSIPSAQENFIPIIDEESELYELTYNPEYAEKEKEGGQ